MINEMAVQRMEQDPHPEGNDAVPIREPFITMSITRNKAVRRIS
jgi:hypothetical protein